MRGTGNSGSDLYISYWQAGTSTQVKEEWKEGNQLTGRRETRTNQGKEESRKQMRWQDRSSTSDFPKLLKVQGNGGVHLGSNGCSPRLHNHSNRQLPKILNHSSR